MTHPTDAAIAQANELMACPFCSFGKPDVRDNRTDAFWIKCPVCEAETTGFDTRTEAIAAWNRRAPPAQSVQVASNPGAILSKDAEAVERVAEAISQLRHLCTLAEVEELMGKVFADDCRDYARAAIAAMQAEPQ